MSTKKQFHEIRFPATEKVTARTSLVGATIVGDLVTEGQRTIVAKFPAVEVVAKKTKSHKKAQAVPTTTRMPVPPPNRATEFDPSKLAGPVPTGKE